MKAAFAFLLFLLMISDLVFYIPIFSIAMLIFIQKAETDKTMRKLLSIMVIMIILFIIFGKMYESWGNIKNEEKLRNAAEQYYSIKKQCPKYMSELINAKMLNKEYKPYRGYRTPGECEYRFSNANPCAIHVHCSNY